MARIANPKSKRGSVQLLEQDFGVSLSLEKVYRMMGKLDDNTISRLLVDDLSRQSIGSSRKSVKARILRTNNYGYKKFLIIKGKTSLSINQDKIDAERRCDGLHGVITNLPDTPRSALTLSRLMAG